MPALLRALAVAGVVLAIVLPAAAQELEPRSYTASPVGTNFALVTFSDSRGQVDLDPSLPISDVRASVNTAALGFSQTFGLFGNAGSWSVAIPYLGAHVSADVFEQAMTGSRYGFPDARVRLALNLVGPALTPREFARRKPATTVGLSLAVTVPTGTYDPTHLANVGSNRWSFRPEIGFEQPLGKWFADGSAGITVFGANANYFGGKLLQQAPLSIFQIHAGYNFRPGQWLALDANYYTGGSTSVDGATPIGWLANSRYGLSYSQPLSPGVSAKLAWSHWLNGTYGQSFSTTTLTLQYRWFRR